MNNKNIHELAYFNLLKTNSWIEEQLKQALKIYNLTHAQLNALYVLFVFYPEPVAVKVLKSRMLVNNPDMTRLLDRLVNKGFILREICPENRRKVDVTLSVSGKDLFINAHQAAEMALENFFKNKISEEEAALLRSILHKIRE